MLDKCAYTLSRNHNTTDHFCNVECDSLLYLVSLLIFFVVFENQIFLLDYQAICNLFNLRSISFIFLFA